MRRRRDHDAGGAGVHRRRHELHLAALDRDGGSGPYTITSRVPVPGVGPGQLNEAALRAAGTDYPPEVVALFTGFETKPEASPDNARPRRAPATRNEM